MKMVSSCPICKYEQCEEIYRTKVQYPGSDLQSNLLNIDYIRNYVLFDKILYTREPIEACFQICTNCGFIFFSPRPEEGDMAIKYDFVNELGDTRQRDEFMYHGLTCDDKRAFEICKHITLFLEVNNNTNSSNVIDLGGSSGLNLKYFLNDSNCFVVDYERRDLIAGTKYLCKTIEDMPKSMQAKVVLYCHTLEHVVDPVKEILKIKDILEPSGLLYIEVPFGCWNEYKHTRNLLTHINFFSEASLYYLLDMCELSVRYLRLKPTLGRVRYGLVIVAIAENSSPKNREDWTHNSITRNQMNGKNYRLRVYQALLNVKLMKFKLLIAAYRFYQIRRQIQGKGGND
jgi:SAM-dependent methyltransferase